MFWLFELHIYISAMCVLINLGTIFIRENKIKERIELYSRYKKKDCFKKKNPKKIMSDTLLYLIPIYNIGLVIGYCVVAYTNDETFKKLLKIGAEKIHNMNMKD